MASPIGDIRNVKIFVLYLMDNIGYPLDYLTINDIVMQNEYVMYLDFAEAFGQMTDDGLVKVCGKNESGDDLFEVTPHGRCVAEELHSDILPSILRRSLKCALLYIDFKKRGIKAATSSEKLNDSRYRVHFVMTENRQKIYETHLVVDSLTRAENMQEYFMEHTDVIYKSTHALLSGNVDYLFG